MAVKENMKVHRPTFISTLVIVGVVLLVYHFTLGGKRKR